MVKLFWDVVLYLSRTADIMNHTEPSLVGLFYLVLLPLQSAALHSLLW